MKKPNRLSLIAASLAVVLTATACGTNAYEATSVPVKSPEPVKSPAPPAKQDCTNALAVLRPGRTAADTGRDAGRFDHGRHLEE